MHNTLRDAFMVEVIDLFAKNKIFEQHRAARHCFQRILIVGNGESLVGGQRRVAAAGVLMQFARIARAVGNRGSVARGRGIGVGRKLGFR